MKPTFSYQQGDDHITFSAYCGSLAEADETKNEIQSLCGSPIEQDGDFLYVMVDPSRLDEAIEELETMGYSTEDGDVEGAE